MVVNFKRIHWNFCDVGVNGNISILLLADILVFQVTFELVMSICTPICSIGSQGNLPSQTFVIICSWFVSTKFKSFEGKQDNKSQGGLFRWLFKNQWVYLSRWYAKLELVIEDDGLKIHDFYNGQEIHDKKMSNHITMYICE